ncbi:hypothetical protein JL107_02695 [Nakamurella flavida]|uniref:Uncharacterized protein n=1 Tax=Nakamurella flavida TaxID=363630 RepID=A0A938YLY3_9ACTN|nr:hypothetical protein [Nakamurella flavida]MBM9475345.1 hypothetical protein [Nakamurella flavida]MDP9776922.1 hypothetical protein [Nakamurella flavida]
MNFFLSAGFGGLCAVIGAAIAYAAATLATRQKSKTDADQRRQGEVAAAWDRFKWVMDHRDEFSPALTISLTIQLTQTADRLGDPDLVAIGREIGTELLRQGELAPADPSSTTGDDPADTELDQEGT